MISCDLAVIGAGPGGYIGALSAARKGLSCVLIDRRIEPGGTCLNAGCIPTKAFLASAERLRAVRNAAEFGVLADRVSPDWNMILERKNRIVSTLGNGIGNLLRTSGVQRVTGEASFLDAHTLFAGQETVQAKQILIACGSEALVPGFLPKSDRVLTSTELLGIDRIPESLLILGGGVIGCEFATIFSAMGTRVTIVEMQSNILPNLDRDLSQTAALALRKNGVEILSGAPLSDISASETKICAKAGERLLEAEYLLCSIGRKSVVSALKIENAGISADSRSWIPVDSYCRTNVPHIYAAGDVTGKWQLAHAASAMAETAVANMSGERIEFHGENVPACIFTDPEIAVIGRSRAECKNAGIRVRTGKFPFAASGKALASGESSGFARVLETDDGKIAGIQIIGPHASDLIGEAVSAFNKGIPAQELGKMIHPHPTLTEVLMEAALAAEGNSLHQQAHR